MQTSNIQRRNLSRFPTPKGMEPVSKQQVRDMIRSLTEQREEKYSSFSLVPGTVDFNGTVVSLSDIDQGVTDSTRIGDQVILKEIEFSYWGITGSANSIMRVILFQWLDLEPPTIGDVLITTGGSAVSPLSLFNQDEVPSRRVIMDDLFYLNAVDKTNYVRQFKAKVPVAKCQFEGGTTDGRGKVYYLAISSSNANLPTFGYQSKLTYSDA